MKSNPAESKPTRGDDAKASPTADARLHATKGKARGTPSPTVDEELESPAKTLSEEYFEAYEDFQKAAATAVVVKDLEEFIYFYRCESCGKPAIFFKRKPVGELIRDHEWVAVYKEADEPWEGDIPCQACMRRGREQYISVIRPEFRGLTREQRRGHPFRITGRTQIHLCKMPKDPQLASEVGHVHADDDRTLTEIIEGRHAAEKARLQAELEAISDAG